MLHTAFLYCTGLNITSNSVLNWIFDTSKYSCCIVITVMNEANKYIMHTFSIGGKLY